LEQERINLPKRIDDVAAAFTKTFIAKPKEPLLTPGLLSRTIEYNALTSARDGLRLQMHDTPTPAKVISDL